MKRIHHAHHSTTFQEGTPGEDLAQASVAWEELEGKVEQIRFSIVGFPGGQFFEPSPEWLHNQQVVLKQATAVYEGLYQRETNEKANTQK